MKKGFTLVELLAVIAILAVIALIAIPTGMGVSKNVKKKMYCQKRDMILVEAKNWGNNNLDKVKATCYYRIKVKTLVEDGYLKKEDNPSNWITNPYTNRSMDNENVYLYLKNNRATAWLNETEPNLIDACDDKIPTDRPSTCCNC